MSLSGVDLAILLVYLVAGCIYLGIAYKIYKITDQHYNGEEILQFYKSNRRLKKEAEAGYEE